MNISFDSAFSYLQPSLPRDAVRVGNEGDGGYVVSKDSILEADLLLSFGMGEDISFEVEFNKLNSIASICTFDHTVPLFDFKFLLRAFVSSAIAKKPTSFLRKYTFYKGYRNFYEKNEKHRHARDRVVVRRFRSVDRTINEILEDYSEKKKIFIKIDIEGDEYKIIDELTRLDSRLCGLVIEFHDAGTRYEEFKRLVTTLNKFMRIDHFHVNNFDGLSKSGFPEVVELTFSNKASNVQRDLITELPIRGLDFPNFKRGSDYKVQWL
jgi:hypothetical protein